MSLALSDPSILCTSQSGLYTGVAPPVPGLGAGWAVALVLVMVVAGTLAITRTQRSRA